MSSRFTPRDAKIPAQRPHDETQTLLVHLRGKSAASREDGAAALVALPIHLRRAGIELRYFTTLTTLGTPLDVTAQELRIEGYFPMDSETEAFGRRLSAEALASSKP